MDAPEPRVLAQYEWSPYGGRVGCWLQTTHGVRHRPRAGPEGLFLGPEGRVYLIDSVNDRVMQVGGKEAVREVKGGDALYITAGACGDKGAFYLYDNQSGRLLMAPRRGGVKNAELPGVEGVDWLEFCEGYLVLGDYAKRKVSVYGRKLKARREYPWTGNSFACRGGLLWLFSYRGEQATLRCYPLDGEGEAREVELVKTERYLSRFLGVSDAGEFYFISSGADGRRITVYGPGGKWNREYCSKSYPSTDYPLQRPVVMDGKGNVYFIWTFGYCRDWGRVKVVVYDLGGGEVGSEEVGR